MADPRYKMYGSEDIDFSWELAQKGYLCAVHKEVYVHHFRHKSITENNLNRELCLKINNELFFNKWSQHIKDMLNEELEKANNLEELLNTESDHSYWFLRRINEIVKFWDGRKINEQKFKQK